MTGKRRGHTCPSCRGHAIQRDLTVRGVEAWWLWLIRRKAYVCRDCHARFYDRPTVDRS